MAIVYRIAKFNDVDLEVVFAPVLSVPYLILNGVQRSVHIDSVMQVALRRVLEIFNVAVEREPSPQALDEIECWLSSVRD